MLSGVVFIAEEFDRENPTMWSGRFFATWQSDDGASRLEGPRGVSADEAIAWGREHAEVVLIRLADSHEYQSAGIRQATEFDAPLPVWVPGAEVPRRRDPSATHLDLVSEEPIDWDVLIEPDLFATRAEDLLTRIQSVLDAAPHATEGSVQPGEDAEHLRIRFVVRADSYLSAQELVFEVYDELAKVLPLSAPLEGCTTVYVPMGLDPIRGLRPRR